ncbi:hypothetical protein ACFE04_028922 [Oxalis oulophora]
MGDPNSDDWLPEGWEVEVRKKSSGQKYKCYSAPPDGLKFYSKPQVQRYLIEIGHKKSAENDKNHSKLENEEKNEVPSKTLNECDEKDRGPSKTHDEFYEKGEEPSNICSESEEKDNELHDGSHDMDNAGDLNSDDWLPEGWEVQCYFAPSDGLKFYSKRQVQRYLIETGHKNSAENDKNHIKLENKEKNEIHSKTPNECDERKDRGPSKKHDEFNEKGEEPSKICGESEEKDDELHDGSHDMDKCPTKHQDESEEMDTTLTKQSSKNVVFEKADTEGLPAGWRKEIKLTKKGRKIRRDPLYIDPVTGYIFNSLKDVLRYLDTGKLGHLARKPKQNIEKDFVNTDNDQRCSPSEAKKQKLDVNGTSAESIKSQSRESHEMTKDEPILDDTASIGECKSSFGCPSDKCGVSEDSGNSDLAEVVGSSKHEEVDKKMEESASVMNFEGGLGSESKGSKVPDAMVAAKLEVAKYLNTKSAISAVPVDTLPDKKSLESGLLNKNERKRTNTKKTKELSTPRRASKRLARVPLDPKLAVETICYSRRVEVKPSGEPELKNTVENCKSTEDFPKSSTSTQLPTQSLYTSNSLTEKISDGKLLLGDISTLGCEGNGEIIDKVNEKPKTLPEVPLPDLWTDPCIAFAIKTLTGASFDNSETTELSTVTKSCASPSDGMSIVENISMKEEVRQTNDKNQGCSVAFPVKNLTEGSSHNKEFGNNEKATDMPFKDIWRDPCIEFAIKTLTGTIPVGLDTSNRDYYQQQQQQQQPINVSQAQVSSGSNLPDFGLDRFCKTEYLCQQFDSAPKEQKSAQPEFNPSKRAGLQNSGATNPDQWKWKYRG